MKVMQSPLRLILLEYDAWILCRDWAHVWCNVCMKFYLMFVLFCFSIYRFWSFVRRRNNIDGFLSFFVNILLLLLMLLMLLWFFGLWLSDYTIKVIILVLFIWKREERAWKVLHDFFFWSMSWRRPFFDGAMTLHVLLMKIIAWRNENMAGDSLLSFVIL